MRVLGWNLRLVLVAVHLVQREPRAGARVALLADEDAAERDGRRRVHFRAQRDLFPFRKCAARFLMLDRRRRRARRHLGGALPERFGAAASRHGLARIGPGAQRDRLVGSAVGGGAVAEQIAGIDPVLHRASRRKRDLEDVVVLVLRHRRRHPSPAGGPVVTGCHQDSGLVGDARLDDDLAAALDRLHFRDDRRPGVFGARCERREKNGDERGEEWAHASGLSRRADVASKRNQDRRRFAAAPSVRERTTFQHRFWVLPELRSGSR